MKSKIHCLNICFFEEKIEPVNSRLKKPEEKKSSHEIVQNRKPHFFLSIKNVCVKKNQFTLNYHLISCELKYFSKANF